MSEPYSLPRFWIYLLLLGLGLGIGYQILSSFVDRSPTPPSPASGATNPSEELVGVPMAPASAPARQLRVKHATVASRYQVTTPAAAPAQNAAPPAPPLPASSAHAQQLINQLTQVSLGGGALTADQAQQLKQNLSLLTQQGADAVPAIREFLARNQDLNFGEGSPQLVGYPTLRVGLLDGLRQIGGPEAVDVSRQVLQTTANPLELAVVARNLEEAAPGQHRAEVLSAARETLAQIAEGKLPAQEVAPLFQVLQTYGDGSVAAALEKTVPQYSYYALMALAGLPSGEGIPSLVQLTKSAVATGTGQSVFALQMLAQVSAQYPDAATALVELARQNQIPDSAWLMIAHGLGGDQYQFVRQLPDDTFPVSSGPGVKTYHTSTGNQNFYSTALSENWPATEIDRRRSLVDQLLAANPNPTAAQALAKAQAWLTGNRTGK